MDQVKIASCLDDTTIEQLRQLLARVIAVDHYLPETHLQYAFAKGSYYQHLLYEQKGIALGWLKCFIFSQYVVECFCIIDPSARRQGVASKLFSRLLKQYPHLANTPIEFSCNKPDIDWLTTRGARYHHCLTTMVSVIQPVAKTAPTVTANIDDSQQLLELDKICFKDMSLCQQQLNNQLKRGDVILVNKVDSAIIAKLHMHRDNQTVKYYNICTHPDFRKQGLASMLLASAHDYCQGWSGVRRLIIDIEDQPRLQQFYERAGFSTLVNHYFYRVNKPADFVDPLER